MKRANKLLAVALVCIMALSLVACSPANNDNAAPTSSGNAAPTSGGNDVVPSSAPKGKYSDISIGVILPIGGLGDNAIADGTYAGISKAAEKLGFKFDTSEPVNEQDREAMIADYSESGDYDLIIAVSTEVTQILQDIQPSYPNQKYLVHDAMSEIKNTVCEYFDKAELGFMAGAFMALMEPYGELTIDGKTQTWKPSNKFGLIVGSEFPATIPPMTGAAAGIKYINPAGEYMYGIVGNWTDQAKNKEIALSMYNEGCNFVLHNSGAGSAGILSAAQESNRFMIGYDSNKKYVNNPNVPASTDKNNIDALVRVLTEFCESGGQLNWGSGEENNYSNGGTLFVYNEGAKIPEEVITIMKDIQTKLEKGEIEIPETWEDVKAFNKTYSK